MANSFKTTTNTWVVDTAETLQTTGCHVIGVLLIQNAAADVITITDTSDNLAFTVSSADITVKGYAYRDFSAENGGKGRRLPSLKVGTLTASATAEIYLYSGQY